MLNLPVLPYRSHAVITGLKYTRQVLTGPFGMCQPSPPVVACTQVKHRYCSG